MYYILLNKGRISVRRFDADLYILKKIKITAVSSVFTEQPLLTINIVSIASEVYQN